MLKVVWPVVFHCNNRHPEPPLFHRYLIADQPLRSCLPFPGLAVEARTPVALACGGAEAGNDHMLAHPVHRKQLISHHNLWNIPSPGFPATKK